MQAAFVNIGVEKNTFIHVQDIVPKVDITKEECRTVNIKDVIKPNMPIIIQVKRDSINKKGARVSSHISLPGRFIVLMPNVPFVTISQKIENNNEKNRLLNIVEKTLPKNFGAIIRTSAENKNEDEINNDINSLIVKWNEIFENAKNESEAPKILYKSNSITKKILIDLIDKKIDRIIVNKENLKNEINEILNNLKINNLPEIILEENIISKFCLEKQIEDIEKRKIWLKCGGFITIDKTEALIAIDVNSGKYVGKETLEKTVFNVNKEATIEIVKQLRLRDLEGIIIIDYIDMKSEENKKKILEILNENLKFDRSKTQVLGFTKLNLLEMTRKHMYSNIQTNL